MSIRFWWRCTLFLIYPSGKLCSQCPRNIVGSLKPKCLRKGGRQQPSLSKKKRLKSVHSLCQASPGKSFAHPLCPAFKQRIFIAKSSARLWPRMQCALHKGKAIHTANTSRRVHLHADTMMATAYVKEIAYWTRQNMSGQHITVLHQFQQSASVFTSAGLLFTKLFLIIHKALDIIIHNAIIIIHWALHYYPQSKYYSHNLSCTILLNNIHGTLKVFSRALSILLCLVDGWQYFPTSATNKTKLNTERWKKGNFQNPRTMWIRMYLVYNP